MSDFPDIQGELNDLHDKIVTERIALHGPGDLPESVFARDPRWEARLDELVDAMPAEWFRNFVKREAWSHSNKAGHDRPHRRGDAFIEEIIFGQLQLSLGGVEFPAGAYVYVGEGQRVKPQYLEFAYFEMEQLKADHAAKDMKDRAEAFRYFNDRVYRLFEGGVYFEQIADEAIRRTRRR